MKLSLFIYLSFFILINVYAEDYATKYRLDIENSKNNIIRLQNEIEKAKEKYDQDIKRIRSRQRMFGTYTSRNRISLKNQKLMKTYGEIELLEPDNEHAEKVKKDRNETRLKRRKMQYELSVKTLKKSIELSKTGIEMTKLRIELLKKKDVPQEVHETMFKNKHLELVYKYQHEVATFRKKAHDEFEKSQIQMFENYLSESLSKIHNFDPTKSYQNKIKRIERMISENKRDITRLLSNNADHGKSKMNRSEISRLNEKYDRLKYEGLKLSYQKGKNLTKMHRATRLHKNCIEYQERINYYNKSLLISENTLKRVKPFPKVGELRTPNPMRRDANINVTKLEIEQRKKLIIFKETLKQWEKAE